MPSFAKILDLAADISKELPEAVFIGGVAVYLHASRAHGIVDASHDADFMVSIADYSTFKDMEEVTYNDRLRKHHATVDGVGLDIYVERQNRLVVPYDEAFASSEVIDGTRVACLEHLLPLKLEALLSRGHSSHGDKDRKDVVAIGLLLGKKPRSRLIEPYMRPELVEELRDLARSKIFHDIAAGNAHAAKKMRASFAAFVSAAR